MPELYTFDECRDLYADAFCIGRQRECLFLSLWGRDTALQELLARLTLPTADNGLDSLHLCQGDTRHPMVFGDMDRYSRRSARVRQTRFGTLVHVWLFDQRCITPDRANLHSIALLDDEEGTCPVDDQLWPRVRELCPLPLLDHWRAPVMTISGVLSGIGCHSKNGMYRPGSRMETYVWTSNIAIREIGVDIRRTKTPNRSP